VRCVVLLLVVGVGCDGVFGIDSVDKPARDAATTGDTRGVHDAPDDGPRGALYFAAFAPPPVFVGDRARFQPYLHGPPGATAMVTSTAQVGTVTPPTASVTLDGNGTFQLSELYTAPSTAGQDTVTFSAATSTQLMAQLPVSFSVQPLQEVGIDGVQTSTEAINPNIAIGLRVTLAAPATIRKIGFYARTSGTIVQSAVYSVVPSGVMMYYPMTLQVAPPFQTVANGRNLIDVTPTQVPAGDYWIITVFNASTTVDYQASGIFGSEGYPYGTPFPQQWAAQWIDTANKSYAMFLLYE
jgi:hypothetical protein